MTRKLLFSLYLGNLSEKEIGNPILDVVLEPGDLLYFPRGTIHQVKFLSQCLLNMHSYTLKPFK